MIVRALLVLAFALPVFARTQSWRSLDVTARLDRDGNLRVVERHVMLFDGDWNGGEREYRVTGRQSLEVNRVVRIEGTKEIPLTEGDLDAVDEWDLLNGTLVRWRSRLPEDPPFANRELTYAVDVTYRNVLVPRDDDPRQFTLAHDFGLPDREGVIERFTLDLTYDPIWGNFAPVHIERENVQPGANEVVQQQLTFGGEGDPAGVRRPVAMAIPLAALAFFAAGVGVLIARFLKEERATGRFEPIVPRFDPALLQIPPEIAGAMWDAGIGAPEVAAVLARLTQEGKLATRTDKDTLHLTLKVSRRELIGYDHTLVTKLFYDGRDTTDSDSIRVHYSKTGFDPASHIRPGIEEKLTRLVSWDQKVKRFHWLLDALAIFGALALTFAAVFASGGYTGGIAVIVLFFSGFVTVFAAVAAYHFSRRIADITLGVVVVSILGMMVSLPFVIGCLAAREADADAPTLFALAFWTLTLLHLILDLFKITDPPDLIGYRKRIAGARRYFLDELRKAQPDMRDEWFPYVIAFGLGSHVDRWFRAFGGTSRAQSSTWSSSSSTSSSSSSSASSSSWTGGGGAFGGAGASGTWAVAAGGIAAGVAAPSSSGSGSSSGGGGSSSSGGGGGGGW
ncbi:MAG TPA: hypothetical protein VEK11_05800 [Thermoanaerobaculia bacterium]|nr:hypothetical protein [Thermoanaerobaculia bacterium]